MASSFVEQTEAVPPPLFPSNVWLQVFECGVVSAADLCRVATVCRSLSRLILRENRLWGTKFAQRWPQLSKRFPFATRGWYHNYRNRHLVTPFLSKLLSDHSASFIRSDHLHVAYSSIRNGLDDATHFGDHYVVFLEDELRSILNDGNSHKNLTHKFYAKQVLSFLVRHVTTSPLLTEYLQSGCLDLETGCVLFAQWFLPECHVDQLDVSAGLDAIVTSAKERLEKAAPKHPLFSQNISDAADSDWSEERRRQVITAVSITMVDDFGLTGDSRDDTENDIERCCINRVLVTRLGRPISMCVIFYAVAKRLGVRCDLVSFPRRFFLRFLEHPSLPSESERYTYINVWDRCRQINEEQLWTWLTEVADTGILRNRSFLNGVTAQRVLERMVYNHLQNVAGVSERTYEAALELAQLLSPSDWRLRLSLSRYYTERMRTNFDEAIRLLEESRNGASGCPFMGQVEYARDNARAALANQVMESVQQVVSIFVVPKLRSSSRNRHVKWAVGQIMKHKKYEYTCVITGWDPVCAANAGWQQQMGVAKLPRGAHQPFYNVLVMDGSNRYAAEENMVFEPNPVALKHPEVGKHFDEFRGTYYRLNCDKRSQYPLDYEATLEHAKQYHQC